MNTKKTIYLYTCTNARILLLAKARKLPVRPWTVHIRTGYFTSFQSMHVLVFLYRLVKLNLIYVTKQ